MSKILIIAVAFCLILNIACTKQNEVARPAFIDFSKLTTHQWLSIPRPDTSFYAGGLFQQFQDTVIINDTIVLIFRNDSTMRDRRFSTEKWMYGTVPVPPPAYSNYLPHGGSDYSGVYSLNVADSNIKSTITVQGITFQPVIHKVLLLTNDSLKLYNAYEGVRSYYAR